MGFQSNWLEIISIIAKLIATIGTVIGPMYAMVKWMNSRRYKYFSLVITPHEKVYGNYKNLEKTVLKYARSPRDVLFWMYAIPVILVDLILVLDIWNRLQSKSPFVNLSPQEFFVIVVMMFSLGVLFLLIKHIDASSKLVTYDIGKRINASSLMVLLLTCSLMIVVFDTLLILNIPSHIPEESDATAYYYYIGSGMISGVTLLIAAFLFSGIIARGISVLWKNEVSRNIDFAEDLPHLVVKTKTGSTFFGQLYDPLDSKLLVLRNASIVTSDKLNDAIGRVNEIPSEKDGRYLAIPWDEIETLQLVESGLYAQQANQYGESGSSKEKSGLGCLASWLLKNTLIKFWGLFKGLGLWIKNLIKNSVKKIDDKLRRRFC